MIFHPLLQMKIQSINVCFDFIKNYCPLFFLANTSIISSEQSPYVWDQSLDNISENLSSSSSSKELTPEYNGRMISQSTISNGDYLRSKDY